MREESEPEREVFTQAKPVDPAKLAARENTTFEAKMKKESDDDQVSIQFRRPKKKLKKIRDFLEKPSLSASRIGEHTFDWFYDRNCR